MYCDKVYIRFARSVFDRKFWRDGYNDSSAHNAGSAGFVFAAQSRSKFRNCYYQKAFLPAPAARQKSLKPLRISNIRFFSRFITSLFFVFRENPSMRFFNISDSTRELGYVWTKSGWTFFAFDRIRV